MRASFEAKPQAQFRICDWGVLERLVARGDIGLGEDYIAGAWETDDLEALISYFLINLEELSKVSHTETCSTGSPSRCIILLFAATA